VSVHAFPLLDNRLLYRRSRKNGLYVRPHENEFKYLFVKGREEKRKEVSGE
jgi:hypothetical protein